MPYFLIASQQKLYTSILKGSFRCSLFQEAFPDPPMKAITLPLLLSLSTLLVFCSIHQNLTSTKGFVDHGRPLSCLVWTTRAHCGRGALGDTKECASGLCQSGQMGCYPPTPVSLRCKWGCSQGSWILWHFQPTRPQARVLSGQGKRSGKQLQVLMAGAGDICGNCREWRHGDRQVCCRQHGFLQPEAPAGPWAAAGTPELLTKGNHVCALWKQGHTLFSICLKMRNQIKQTSWTSVSGSTHRPTSQTRRCQRNWIPILFAILYLINVT